MLRPLQAARYNPPFENQHSRPIMEAEQLNSLAATLADLKVRSEDLRRYL